MTILNWSELSAAERAAALARPSEQASAEVAAAASAIAEDVRERGWQAASAWSEKLDGRPPARLEITPERLAEARAQLDPDDCAALTRAAAAVRRYHEALRPEPLAVDMGDYTLRREWRPISPVGLYIPGGTAPLFSTLLMTAIPARVAGCAEIVAVTPPARAGTDGGAEGGPEGAAVHPMMLLAAAEAGLDALWLIGGAQAIAAMAFGAGDIPRCAKIFGPGNAYVAAAKTYVSSLPGGPAIDLPAGPSELLVIADAEADPVLVAADLLSQAEHDRDAQVILVSDDARLLERAEAETRRQLADLPRRAIAEASLHAARFILTDTLEAACAVSDAYAPEHLALHVAEPELLVSRLSAAGAVFAGAMAAETLGDYVSGPSHVLPTGGAARAHGGVTVESFLRPMSVQSVTAKAAARLGADAARLARLEGLEAHARAGDLRAELARSRKVMARQALAAALSQEALEAADIDAALAEAGLRTVPAPRRASVRRDTKETRIAAAVDLDAAGPVKVATGNGFWDHMLEQIAKHGGFALDLACEGDLHVDAHHTVEDCALALGEALRQALGDKRGIERYGFTVPMDEAQASVAIDLSGRPFSRFEGVFKAAHIGEYPTEMTGHVFRSLADAMGAAIHVKVEGENDHHKTEACFKAFGRALRIAIRREGGSAEIPSTKGVL